MLVQINSNNSVDVTERMVQWATEEIQNSMKRFASRITRIEAQFNDVNSDKGGDFDKYCSLEARLEGKRPMAVNNKAASFDLALGGALEKLEKVISRDTEKAENKKGRTPFGGEPFADMSEDKDDDENSNTPLT